MDSRCSPLRQRVLKRTTAFARVASPPRAHLPVAGLAQDSNPESAGDAESQMPMLLRSNAFCRPDVGLACSLREEDDASVTWVDVDSDGQSSNGQHEEAATGGLREARGWLSGRKTRNGCKEPRTSKAKRKVLKRSKALTRSTTSLGCSSPSRKNLRTVPVPRDVWEAAEQEELHTWDDGFGPVAEPCDGDEGSCDGRDTLRRSSTCLSRVQTLGNRIGVPDVEKPCRVNVSFTALKD